MTAEDKKRLRKEEEQIALYLVNHYEDVKKIEFVNFHFILVIANSQAISNS